jgi:hypothetical protein
MEAQFNVKSCYDQVKFRQLIFTYSLRREASKYLKRHFAQIAFRCSVASCHRYYSNRLLFAKIAMISS